MIDPWVLLAFIPAALGALVSVPIAGLGLWADRRVWLAGRALPWP